MQRKDKREFVGLEKTMYNKTKKKSKVGTNKHRKGA